MLAMSNVTCNPFVYFWLNKVNIVDDNSLKICWEPIFFAAFSNFPEKLLLLGEPVQQPSEGL